MLFDKNLLDTTLTCSVNNQMSPVVGVHDLKSCDKSVATFCEPQSKGQSNKTAVILQGHNAITSCNQFLLQHDKRHPRRHRLTNAHTNNNWSSTINYNEDAPSKRMIVIGGHHDCNTTCDSTAQDNSQAVQIAPHLADLQQQSSERTTLTSLPAFYNQSLAGAASAKDRRSERKATFATLATPSAQSPHPNPKQQSREEQQWVHRKKRSKDIDQGEQVVVDARQKKDHQPRVESGDIEEGIVCALGRQVDLLSPSVCGVPTTQSQWQRQYVNEEKYDDRGNEDAEFSSSAENRAGQSPEPFYRSFLNCARRLKAAWNGAKSSGYGNYE